jgi:hypothetical protein
MVAASYHQHVCDMTNNILLITFLFLPHIIGTLLAKTFSDLKTYGGAELLPHIISMLLYDKTPSECYLKKIIVATSYHQHVAL